MKSLTLITAGAFLALCAITNPVHAAPETNAPAMVQIVTPQSGGTFLLGKDIEICSLSQNFTDSVASVEFFAGTNSIGTVTNYPEFRFGRGWPASRPEFTCFLWTNAPVGGSTLTAIALDAAGNSATSAPVDISVVTNIPPLVRIIEPRDGAEILGPTNITIAASAFDPYGSVASVQFFEDTNLLGTVSNSPPVFVTNRFGVFPILQTLYSLTWSNVAPGSYSLTAVATDNGGVSSTSAVVDITVVTDLPPVVKITSPESGTRFYAPADVGICADAHSPAGGSISNVEFFADAASIGVATNGFTFTNDDGVVKTLFCVTWSNSVPATYSLTATATDQDGETGTSAPVVVTILAPPPPLVKIVSPENGAQFVAPADIYLATFTRFFTNPIASVDFYANTNLIGVVSNTPWAAFLWTNVAAGSYSLTAAASTTNGLSVTSAPVSITVSSNRPPFRWGWGDK